MRVTRVDGVPRRSRRWRRGDTATYSFLVLDHRQGHDAPVRRHDGLEGLEVDPEVVRVEVAVLADVLEGVLVLVGALRRLPQDELALPRR